MERFAARFWKSLGKRFRRDLARNHYLEDFCHDFGSVFRHDFGRDWESWEIILEEIWPQITIWKTSVMILEKFFDTILEEIGGVGKSFWKRFGRDLATNHYLEDFCHDFGRVFRHDFGRDSESDGRVRPKIEKSNFWRDLRLAFGRVWGRDLEEIWPEITIWKTSVMIVEEFFDTILEEIGRVMEEFDQKKRNPTFGEICGSILEEFGEEISKRFGHKSLFGRLLS